MATNTLTHTKTDAQLQSDVQEELRWEPSIDASEMGIIVKDGVVALTGFAKSYYEKRMAEKAVERVSGVKAVAEEIEVKLPIFNERTDTDIARSALNALASHVTLPFERIKVKVENGWVTLDGEVDWFYQKAIAESAVQGLLGVQGLSNYIRVEPKVTPAETKTRIEATLRRHAGIDDRNIDVTVDDRKVILNGNVQSWSERYEAERVAWTAPGVSEVVNQLIVMG